MPSFQALIFSRENVHFAFCIDIKEQFTTANLHDFFSGCQMFENLKTNYPFFIPTVVEGSLATHLFLVIKRGISPRWSK
jgi:hypothetical protein